MRLAQPRALGRKVSDEFTPLCRVHHREVHRTVKESRLVGAFGRRAAGYWAKLWDADPPTADAEGREAHGGLVSLGPRGGALQQIEANRRNAQDSTGPRTEAGKQRSSRNAVRLA